MKKLAKVASVVASAVIATACLAGCGGSSSDNSSASSASSGAESSSSASSGDERSDVDMEDVLVAGLEFELPSDFDAFNYIPSNGNYGTYMSKEENDNAFVVVTELFDAPDYTLAEFDKKEIEDSMFAVYDDVKWESFESGLNAEDEAEYNEGTLTFSANGSGYKSYVRIYCYADEAYQVFTEAYKTEEESTLAETAEDVLASINFLNDTMLDYLYAWTAFNVAGLDTTQLSEADNLEAAKQLLDTATDLVDDAESSAATAADSSASAAAAN